MKNLLLKLREKAVEVGLLVWKTILVIIDHYDNLGE